jgi:hypothetical protein
VKNKILHLLINKMTSKYFCLFLVLFFNIYRIIYGQVNSQIQIGEYYTNEPALRVPGEIIGYDETGFYLYTFHKEAPNDIYVDHFDKQLKRTLTKKVQYLPGVKNRLFEYMMLSNNKIFIFSSYSNSSEGKRYLDVQTIDKNTLTLNNDIKQLIEIDDRYGYRGNFEIKVSKEKSKILIYWDYAEQKSKEEKLSFKAFDGDMNQLWEKEIILPYKDKCFAIESCDIDDSGLLLFTGALFEDKAMELREKNVGITLFDKFAFKKMLKEGKDKNLSYDYMILTYSSNNDTPQEYRLSLEGKFIRDLKMEINKEGDIVCAGFYSNKGLKSIKGTFYIKIDSKSKQIIKNNCKQFSMDFITSGMSESQLKEVNKQISEGNEVEFDQFDLHELIIKEDGGILLIAEQYYYKNFGGLGLSEPNLSRKGGPGDDLVDLFTKNYYRQVLDFHDILVVNINSDGDINWNAKIPKRQISSNHGHFSSFALAQVKDNLYFLYNDNALNYNPKSSYKPYTFNGNVDMESVLVVAQVTKEGKVNKSTLISSKDKRTTVTMVPTTNLQIDENNLIMFGQCRVKKRYSQIKLE